MFDNASVDELGAGARGPWGARRGGGGRIGPAGGEGYFFAGPPRRRIGKCPSLFVEVGGGGWSKVGCRGRGVFTIP